jgi:hypothetical protein
MDPATARIMRDSDARQKKLGLTDAVKKKAAAAGTVTGRGNIQQSTSKPSTKGGAGYIGIGGKKS